MVTFLIFFLILFLSTAFYLIFKTNSKVENNTTKFNSEKSGPKKFLHRKSIHTDYSNRMDENHPIEELIIISEQLDRYNSNDENSESQNSFVELFANTKANLVNLDTSIIIQASSIFQPREQISMMNISDHIHITTSEIIEQINKLTLDTSQIIVISEKVKALTLIEKSLKDLIKKHKELTTKELPEETLKELIEDSLGIAPSLELGRAEYKKFFDFYSTYKAFRALYPFQKIRLQEIQDFTHTILEILKTPNGLLTDDQFQSLQNIQPQLLVRYRNFFDYFKSLNQGIFEGLKILKSSTLRDIRESQTTLIEIIENIEDQIETCNYFCSGSGKSEHEFNNYFNKIRDVMNSNKSSKSVGIGLIESSQSFFEARASDADELFNSTYMKTVDQILSRVIRTIERL